MQRALSGLLGLLALAGGAWGSYQVPTPGCPRMSIKASVGRSVSPGQVVTYKIRVKNSAGVAIENLYIDADLPAYVLYPVPPQARKTKPPYSISPKGLTNGGVVDLGSTIQLQQVTLPPGKTVTFTVRALAQACSPDTKKAVIPFKAQAYLIPPATLTQTCFMHAKPLNATVKATRKSPTCAPGVIPAAPVGAAETVPGVATPVPLSAAPADTYIAPNTPEQDALRAEQRAAKAEWSFSANVGDDAQDPFVQGASVQESEVEVASTTFDWAKEAISNNNAANNYGVYGYTPPDPSHAVGLNHIVTMVNSRIAVYDKAGNQVMAPKNTNTIFAGLPSTDPCRTRNDGDPIAAWDNLNQRFVVSQFTATSPYKQCIAVSQTSDPTGNWWLYSIPLSTTELWDYPKLSIVNDAYVITYNRFTSSYTGGAILLLESPKMAAGLAPQVFMWLTTTAWPVWGYSMLPGGSDNVQGPPPAGSAVPIVALKGTSLVIMKATWNYAAGTASMYGATNPWVLSVASFTRLCPRGACVVQPSTSRRLDGLGDRLMNRLVYNWMGSYDSMVVTHSISTGVRWYEVRNINTGGIGGTPVLYQQGTIPNPSGVTRWFGSAAMDKVGNIGIGFAESGSSLYPSIGYTGRLAGAGLGTMLTPSRAITGTGSLSCTCSRYGDYMSMQVDPVDKCSFFFYGEYAVKPPTSTVSDRGWTTGIVKYRMSNCV